MMGEYIVYYQDKLVGMICDNCFFLKPTEKVLQLLSYNISTVFSNAIPCDPLIRI